MLLLSGSLFMLQVYDRVLPSRSVSTLVGLFVLITTLYAFLGVLDFVRGRMLSRIGRAIDQALSPRVYEAVVRLPLKSMSVSDGLQPIRDLDQLRSFLSSPGPTALFDLPWIPLYLGLCFLFHFWIGVTATAGAVFLIGVTLLTEALARTPVRSAASAANVRLSFAEASRRNAEVIEAMGMTQRFSDRWSAANHTYFDAQERAADVASGFGSVSRILRMLLQSTVLAVGAYLVIEQEATAGIIIASSILTSRALAPVELAIAHWRNFIAARHGFKRLGELLGSAAFERAPTALPDPKRSLSVEAVTIAPPGFQTPVVQGVSFRLEAGQGLGIIGPSASGKSSLIRAIVGIWTPLKGTIRLDGAALDHWSPEQLGRHIGYLPQDIELFGGTVAENIRRFEPEADAAATVEAAQNAYVHEMILRLPEGYDTRIGDGGMALSAGQRQRIALARSVYKNPFLLVLDEPNSNLDAEGEQALTKSIAAIKGRGGIVIVVAHRPSALAAVDLVLAMSQGQSQSFGPKDDVLKKVLRPAASNAAALKVVD